MKNHKSIHTNLRTNSQTKSSLIPESLFIRYLKQITNITYNIGNNSSCLTTPIQQTHNPIPNKVSERTVNCNFEINIPDPKKYIPDNRNFQKSDISPSTYNRSQKLSSEHNKRNQSSDSLLGDNTKQNKNYNPYLNKPNIYIN